MVAEDEEGPHCVTCGCRVEREGQCLGCAIEEAKVEYAKLAVERDTWRRWYERLADK